ncbi:uncharacterized protein WM294_014972 isoform 2-T2 [Sarcoramphus papa]
MEQLGMQTMQHPPEGQGGPEAPFPAASRPVCCCLLLGLNGVGKGSVAGKCLLLWESQRLQRPWLCPPACPGNTRRLVQNAHHR